MVSHVALFALSRNPFNSQQITLGGGRRDRTDDPLLAKQVLSQLSYAPFLPDLETLPANLILVVGLVGLEPTTPRLSSVCSNQLSYRPKVSNICQTLLLAHYCTLETDRRGH